MEAAQLRAKKGEREREDVSEFRQHALNFMGVCSPADILAGVGWLSSLNEKIRSGDVTLLGDDAHATPRRVVIYFLPEDTKSISCVMKFFLGNKSNLHQKREQKRDRSTYVAIVRPLNGCGWLVQAVHYTSKIHR